MAQRSVNYFMNKSHGWQVITLDPKPFQTWKHNLFAAPQAGQRLAKGRPTGKPIEPRPPRVVVSHTADLFDKADLVQGSLHTAPTPVQNGWVRETRRDKRAVRLQSYRGCLARAGILLHRIRCLGRGPRALQLHSMHHERGKALLPTHNAV